MAIWNLMSDLLEAAAPWSAAQAEAPTEDAKDKAADNKAKPKPQKDEAPKEEEAEKEGSEEEKDGKGKEEKGKAGEDEAEEEEEEKEEEEEEEEPELVDPKEQIEEACRNKECAKYKHHYDECAERVMAAADSKGGAKEDCVEEFFHLVHCSTSCAASKLWEKLK